VQNFNHLVHGNIFKLGVEWTVGGNSTENWSNLGNAERYGLGYY